MAPPAPACTPRGRGGLATAFEGLGKMHGWAGRLNGEGRFGDFEQHLLALGFAEYCAQIAGGIPMSQVEIIRPEAMGVTKADIRRFEDTVADMVAAGSTDAVKARLAELIRDMQGATTFGDSGLDETHAEIHEQMRKFSVAEVVPHAHEWHLKNEYIPMEIVQKVADIFIFPDAFESSSSPESSSACVPSSLKLRNLPVRFPFL